MGEDAPQCARGPDARGATAMAAVAGDGGGQAGVGQMAANLYGSTTMGSGKEEEQVVGSPAAGVTGKSAGGKSCLELTFDDVACTV